MSEAAALAVPIAIDPASGDPLYRQVEDQLAIAIRSGSLPPGAKLPPIRDLAADLRVSVITIRRAYVDLEAAGLVIGRQGQGTFVAKEGATAADSLAQREATTALTTALTGARRAGISDNDIRNELENWLNRRQNQ